MITIRDYRAPATLEEAWTLNQKRSNRVLGGMGWMKLSRAGIGTAIDLSALHLDTIEENGEGFRLGAMVSLRALEVHPGLEAAWGGAVRESVSHIVGVQFRNCATVGGTVWLRAGFSDPLTLLLALDSEVELYQGKGVTARVPLSSFLKAKPDNSILTAVLVAKNGRRAAYQSFRNTETDFPVLTAAVSVKDGVYRAAVGARPSRAAAVEAETVPALVQRAQEELSYGSNLRGSAEYRRFLAGTLLRRAAAALEDA